MEAGREVDTGSIWDKGGRVGTQGVRTKEGDGQRKQAGKADRHTGKKVGSAGQACRVGEDNQAKQGRLGRQQTDRQESTLFKAVGWA